jgi:hypothetical protein
MNPQELARLTRKLMDKHGLQAWSYKTNRSSKVAGRCYSLGRVIEMSTKIAAVRSEAETRNTILHEIAHALTPLHGHDGVWAAKHRELGGDGQAHWHDRAASLQMALWVGKCEQGCEYGRQARSYRMETCHCHLHGMRLTWTNKKTGEVVAPKRSHPTISTVAANAALPEPTPQNTTKLELCTKCFTVRAANGACNC